MENTENFIKIVSKRIEQTISHFSDDYKRMSDDLTFAGGDQWDDETAKGMSKKIFKVTNNIIKPYIDRIVNPLRMYPIGGNVDGDELEVVKHKIKSIETASSASEIFEQAYEDSVMCGLGWCEVLIDYADDESEKLTLKIERPSRDPFSCWIDKDSKKVDGSDAKFSFKCDKITLDDANSLYGDNDEYQSTWDSLPIELDEDECQRVTYYSIESISAGSRKKHCRMVVFVGKAIVFDEYVPIPYSPLVPVYADRVRKADGEYTWMGLVQRIKDSQKLVNLYKTLEFAQIKKTPKSQWLLSRGQSSGDSEGQWNNPDRYDSLIYDETSVDGKPLNPPQRIDTNPNVSGLMQPYTQTIIDIGRVLGMPDAMMGIDPANTAESGKAVLARQSVSEISTAQYFDNLCKSIAQITRIEIKLIPIVFVNPEEIDIYDELGDSQKVTVDWSNPAINWNALQANVKSGPAYAGRRKEDVNALMATVQMMPNNAPMMMDIIMAQQDNPGAKLMAKRLKKMLPPELQDNAQTQEQINPQSLQALKAAQGTISQLETEVQTLTSMVNQLQSVIISEQGKQETQIKIEEMRIQKDIIIADKNNETKKIIEGVSSQSKLTQTEMQNQNKISTQLIDSKLKKAIEETKAKSQAISELMQNRTEFPHQSIVQGGLI